MSPGMVLGSLPSVSLILTGAPGDTVADAMAELMCFGIHVLSTERAALSLTTCRAA